VTMAVEVAVAVVVAVAAAVAKALLKAMAAGAQHHTPVARDQPRSHKAAEPSLSTTDTNVRAVSRTHKALHATHWLPIRLDEPPAFRRQTYTYIPGFLMAGNFLQPTSHRLIPRSLNHMSAVFGP